MINVALFKLLKNSLSGGPSGPVLGESPQECLAMRQMVNDKLPSQMALPAPSQEVITIHLLCTLCCSELLFTNQDSYQAAVCAQT